MATANESAPEQVERNEQLALSEQPQTDAPEQVEEAQEHSTDQADRETVEQPEDTEPDMVQVPRAQYDELTAAVTELTKWKTEREQAATSARTDELIAAAQKEGKLAPSGVEAVRHMFSIDFAAGQEFLNKLPAGAIPTSPLGTDAPIEASADDHDQSHLTPAERKRLAELKA